MNLLDDSFSPVRVQGLAKLYLLIKGLTYDPSQGPKMFQRHFQTGGETYEYGWIS